MDKTIEPITTPAQQARQRRVLARYLAALAAWAQATGQEKQESRQPEKGREEHPPPRLPRRPGPG